MRTRRIRRTCWTFVGLVLAAAYGLFADQGALVIRAQRIYTVTGGIIENGTLVIENGKISKLGKDIPVPKGAKVLTAVTVIPGLIDAHSHVGVYSVPVIEENYDGNEATNPVTPQVRALDSFNFDDPAIPAARAAGVTTLVARPGSLNVIGGTSVAVKTKKGSPAAMTIKEDCDLKMAIEGNPSNYYAGLKQMPSTVMAVYFVARKAFTEAQEYRASWDAYDKDKSAGKPVAPPKRDLGKEVLVRALKKEIPVHIHCYTASEAMTSIRLGDEFGLRLSLGHCDKTYLVIDELVKRKDVFYNVGPAVFDLYYQNSLEFANVPAILAKAGLKVSLQTDAGPEQQNLRQFASLCVRYGMTEEDALKSITIHAAEAVDLADRIGSLEAGKDADVVLLDGEPFEFLTAVTAVVIDGRIEYQSDLKREISLPAGPPPAPVSLDLPEAVAATGRYALRGGRILTMAGAPIENGFLLIKDGKIETVGRGPVPAGWPVVETGNSVIMPGLVLARTHAGLDDNWRGLSSFDEISRPVVPEIEVKHGVEPQSPHFVLLREMGITSALVTPGDLEVIGGHGLVLKTTGNVVDRMLLKDRAIMVFGLGSKAKRKQQWPMTRMGIAAQVRETLLKVREYAESREKPPATKEGPPPARDLSLEALIPVIRGEMPVLVHCERKDDILTALKLADEFKLKIILDGATDAYKVVDEIKKRGVPVILENLMRGVGSIEDAGFSNANPAVLAKAGIPLAFRAKEGLWQWPAAGIPGGDLLEIGAFACRYGMPEEAALRAVTIDAARIAGIADRVGSLEPGKDADILVLGGHPFRTASVPEAVFQDGRLVYRRVPGAHLGTYN